jgi:peroxiredoxin Q/BCP
MNKTKLKKANDFKLLDQNHKEHKLSDYKGKWVVLYFYPKDLTPGCTLEATGFSKMVKQFEKLNAVILGVSADTPESHQKFCKKKKLKITLLSDPDKKVIKKYKVWGKKKFMGKEFEGVLRTTYLINSEGKIFKVYKNVNPLLHPQEVLKDLKNFLNPGKYK